MRPAARLEGLSPYVPPARSDRGALLLDANEGRPDVEVVGAALREIRAGELRLYPSAAALERALAGRLGVEPERVVVTNGGDDAIDRVCRSVIEPGREAVVHVPTFEMIGRGVRLAGGKVREIRWMGGPFPARAYLEAIGSTTSLAALVSPNNPTGGVIGLDEVLEIAAAARRVGALVLLDLAYVEFADEDPTERLLGLDNVVMVRTFSKAYGLAGLRVGYAVAPREVAEWLRTVGGPYPVSSVSLALAGRALGGDEADDGQSDSKPAFVERVRRERAELTELLRALGAAPLESQANFVTTRVADAAKVRERLAELGIAVRSFGDPAIADLVRIGLPGEAEGFARLCEGLRAVLGGQGGKGASSG